MRVLNHIMCIKCYTLLLEFPASGRSRKRLTLELMWQDATTVFLPQPTNMAVSPSLQTCTSVQSVQLSAPLPHLSLFRNRPSQSRLLAIAEHALLAPIVPILSEKGLLKSLFLVTNSAVEINYLEARTTVYFFSYVEFTAVWRFW